MQVADPLEFFARGTNGKGILLVHGMTGAPAEMRLVGRQFNRRGYTVYAPLLAGHGRDDRTLRGTSWEDWLATVLRSVDRLSESVERVFVAGICAGGKLGLLAADERPGVVRAVAIYSPCFLYDGWAVPRHFSMLAKHIGWLSHVPFIDRVSFSELPSLGIKDERLRQMMGAMAADGVLERFPGTGLREMHRLGRTLKKRLPSMRTPTLILHAREDDLSGPRHASYINSHIGGPSELRWIDDSYHMIHIDRQHRRVADYTIEYFETNHAPARA
jgi:carboxylesterase